MNTPNPSRKIKQNSKNIATRFDITNETTRKKTSEKLKQKLLAKPTASNATRDDKTNITKTNSS